MTVRSDGRFHLAQRLSKLSHLARSPFDPVTRHRSVLELLGQNGDALPREFTLFSQRGRRVTAVQRHAALTPQFVGRERSERACREPIRPAACPDAWRPIQRLDDR